MIKVITSNVKYLLGIIVSNDYPYQDLTFFCYDLKSKKTLIEYDRIPNRLRACEKTVLDAVQNYIERAVYSFGNILYYNEETGIRDYFTVVSFPDGLRYSLDFNCSFDDLRFSANVDIFLSSNEYNIDVPNLIQRILLHCILSDSEEKYSNRALFKISKSVDGESFYGLMDSYNNCILDLNYRSISSDLIHGCVIVSKDLVNPDPRYANWKKSFGNDKLYQAYGLYNVVQGEMVLEPYYESMRFQSNSILLIAKDPITQLYGAFSLSGKLLIPFEYKELLHVQEVESVGVNIDAFYAADKDWKWGIVSRENNINTSFIYDEIRYSTPGAIKIVRKNEGSIDNRYGLLNVNTGEQIVSCKYREISKCYCLQDVFCLSIGVRDYVFVDNTGNFITEHFQDVILTNSEVVFAEIDSVHWKILILPELSVSEEVNFLTVRNPYALPSPLYERYERVKANNPMFDVMREGTQFTELLKRF